MSIEKRIERLERTQGDKNAPNYIVIHNHQGGPLTDADLQLLAAGRVRIKGYIGGVSPDDWPPAPGPQNEHN